MCEPSKGRGEGEGMIATLEELTYMCVFDNKQAVHISVFSASVT